VRAAIEAHRSVIAGETLAVDVGEPMLDGSVTETSIDGEAARISLRRALEPRPEGA